MNLTVDDVLSVPHKRSMNFEDVAIKKFSGVSTDTRTINRGEIFVALRGGQFDGHQFIDSAFQKGAACAVVDVRFNIPSSKKKPVLVVNDTTKAFGTLANVYRKKFDIPFIAVAGSNGKTTTKEMITAVLQSKYNVLSTKGNLNNHIGVPQTLFRLNDKHEVAVVEVGTNHFGELKYLCEILEPTHGVITNIGHEHLEFFKDLNGVARAEGELFSALRKNGTGFVNGDDPFVVSQSKKLQKKIIYGFSGKNIRLRGKFKSVNDEGCATFTVEQKSKKSFNVSLSVPGSHAMMNAMTAVAVGNAFRVPVQKIQRSLKQFRAVSKRMEMLTVGGVKIINDTYNANTDSVISALRTLSMMNCSGKKIVVLADMLELGKASRQEHAAIGNVISSLGFEYVLTYGAMAKYIHKNVFAPVNIWYEQKNVLAEYALELLSEGDIILVKGSRGMKMEDVISFLQSRLESKR